MHAVIVLGGDLPGETLLRSCLQVCDLSIAADRGLEAFAAAGVTPDLMIGDMDSVRPEVLRQYEGQAEQRRLNCIKDDTDGVDALDVAIARGAERITLLGALGGRLDHALANLMLLIRAHQKGAFAQILSEDVRIVRVNGETTLHGAKGDTVSLLPLGSARGVTIGGFFYPLCGGDLDCSHPLGVSNVVTEEEARVSVADGDLLLFHYYAAQHVKE
ncbi:MAG: thiamine diphosphokinase [Clostridia bacterium]|nr:thiamine diphosphokinase [Clostridia bacterium]